MDFEVTILGSNAAVPANKRFPSAQVCRYGSRSFLIDCGEGTQIQMSRFGIKRGRIQNVLISHLHADHYAGLFGLLGTFILQNRNTPVTVYAPPGLEEIINLQFYYSNTELTFPLHFITLREGVNKIYETEDLEVFSFPLKHRIVTYGFIIKQKTGERKIIKEKALQFDIPVEAFSYLKQGLNYTDESGKTYRYDTLTRPPSAPHSYAYVSDTIYDPSIADIIKDVSLLYHEATFESKLADKARNTMHCTTTQAAEIAKLAGAGKLIIGHFSTRYKKLTFLEEEAREVFSESFAAREGVSYKIN